MLTFFVCLLPVVASVLVPTSENYILDIKDNILKNVQFIDDVDLVLNLSGRNLKDIEKHTFDNVRELESLDLSSNSLFYLPDFIFSKLFNLRSLSLANNQIWDLRGTFIGPGLENLQLLDISRNPLRELTRSNLIGLPKSTRILINENSFFSISTGESSNFFTKEKSVRIKSHPYIVIGSDIEKEIDTKLKRISNMQNKNAKIYRDLDKDIRVTFCIFNGIVYRLDVFKENETLTEVCFQILVAQSDVLEFNLHDWGITSFIASWYGLSSLSVNSLNFSNNWISEITEGTLNYLPLGLNYVNFQNNIIRKIQSQVIENNHLIQLNFKNNLIEEIEGNAFAKTRLHDLDLSGNQLNSLDFVSTLPDTVIKLIVGRNRIISIPNNTFSRLSHLSYLNLRENKIETLQNDIFRNLTSLQMLILARNNITTIEPATFKDLTTLKMLDLQGNFIRDLETSTFAELTALDTLDLSWNKIVTVTFTDLPRNLNTLYLDFNEISALEEGSFIGAPRITLFLSSNRISKIERGAFNLPTLEELFLGYNKLITIKGDSYEGLGRLKKLWLSDNQISKIRKGSCKNLKSLDILYISSNPFQKLKAGALYGLSTDPGTDLHIYNNNLKEMQVGLFDDI